MTVVLWCRNRLLKNRKTPLPSDFLFLKQANHAPLRCEVSDDHVPYPALYIFSLLACTPFSSANTFLHNLLFYSSVSNSNLFNPNILRISELENTLKYKPAAMDKIKAWQIFRTIPGFINKNSDFFAIQRGIHLVVTWTDLSSFFWEYRTPISFYRIRTTPGIRMTF